AHRAVWAAQVLSPAVYAIGGAFVGLGCALFATPTAALAARITALDVARAVVVVGLTGAFMHASGQAYDVRPTSAVLARLEAKGAPLAITMHYSGEFNFYGRLKSRIEPTAPWEVASWANAHRDGYVIAVYPAQEWPPATKRTPRHQALHRGGGLMIWPVADVLAEPGVLPHR